MNSFSIVKNFYIFKYFSLANLGTIRYHQLTFKYLYTKIDYAKYTRRKIKQLNKKTKKF